MSGPRTTTGFYVGPIVLESAVLNAATDRPTGTDVAPAGRLEIRVDSSEVRLSDDGKFQLRQKVEVKGKSDARVDWSAIVVYVGSFRVAANAEIDAESARSVHAPAMLYGFAREYVADFVRRAGLGVAMLPPMNFAAAKRARRAPAKS